jgi:hypothetical protein
VGEGRCQFRQEAGNVILPAEDGPVADDHGYISLVVQMRYWGRQCAAAALVFLGVLMTHTGFWHAAAMGAVVLPLGLLNFTWPVVGNVSTAVFLAGCAMWMLGLRLLP